MSTHYAMCKYDDATGSYIPLEFRPITDKLKKDDPLYQEGFQAGAASRDAEIAELQRKLANEQARDIHSCHPNCTREGCVNRRLRAELTEAYEAGKRDAIPEWQPIETAPKDGTAFRAYADELVDLDFNPCGSVEAVWNGEEFIGCVWNGQQDTWYGKAINPTHWMPLPAAPKGEE